MTTVDEILELLDQKAPCRYAESYDNVGLLAGDGKAAVTKALVCLDITKEMAEYAAREGAQLVVSHHPVIFNPLKRIVAGESDALITLIQNGISAICMHTNLDAAEGGVSDVLAARLGLTEIQPIGDGPSERYVKIRVYLPLNYRMPLIDAMTRAGAGVLGSYQGCCYTTLGAGTFIPVEGASPFCGSVNQREWTQEIAVEMICRKALTERVLEAMRAVHPYEEPAFDVFDIHYPELRRGFAKLGRTAPQDCESFAKLVKETLSAPGVRCAFGGRPVQLVAVLPGAGGEFLQTAVRAGADTVVAGELKHHEWNYLKEQNLNVIEVGHYSSEAPICQTLASWIKEAYPALSVTEAESQQQRFF